MHDTSQILETLIIIEKVLHRASGDWLHRPGLSRLWRRMHLHSDEIKYLNPLIGRLLNQYYRARRDTVLSWAWTKRTWINGTLNPSRLADDREAQSSELWKQRVSEGANYLKASASVAVSAQNPRSPIRRSTGAHLLSPSLPPLTMSASSVETLERYSGVKNHRESDANLTEGSEMSFSMMSDGSSLPNIDSFQLTTSEDKHKQERQYSDVPKIQVSKKSAATVTDWDHPPFRSQHGERLGHTLGHGTRTDRKYSPGSVLRGSPHTLGTAGLSSAIAGAFTAAGVYDERRTVELRWLSNMSDRVLKRMVRNEEPPADLAREELERRKLLSEAWLLYKQKFLDYRSGDQEDDNRRHVKKVSYHPMKHGASIPDEVFIK